MVLADGVLSPDSGPPSPPSSVRRSPYVRKKGLSLSVPRFPIPSLPLCVLFFPFPFVFSRGGVRGVISSVTAASSRPNRRTPPPCAVWVVSLRTRPQCVGGGRRTVALTDTSSSSTVPRLGVLGTTTRGDVGGPQTRDSERLGRVGTGGEVY